MPIPGKNFFAEHHPGFGKRGSRSPEQKRRKTIILLPLRSNPEPMNKPEKAINFFDQGFNCSQSVLTAFSEDFAINENDLMKIACAFGGGMGRQQLTCGAVSGALMVLGLHFGRGINDDISKKGVTYEKAAEFLEAFKKRNGATDCLTLLQGLSFHNPDEMKRIEALNLFKTSCNKYAKDAVEIAQEMIDHK